MRRRLAPLLLLLLSPAFAAQQADLGHEVSSYRRFIVYPHLDKAFSAQQRGDHARAIEEFEAARRLAPESPTILLYLADAYRLHGQQDRAEALLRDAQRRTPNDARIRDALHALQGQHADATAPSSSPASTALQAALAAVQRGDLAAADAALAETDLGSREVVTLRRAYAQRAIYLKRWAAADAQFSALQAAGQLTPQERSQWLQVQLRQNKLAAAGQVVRQSGAARDQLAYALALARRGDRRTLARYLAGTSPAFQQAADEAQWMQLIFDSDRALYARFQPRHPQNRRKQAEALVPQLVRQGQFDAARQRLAYLSPDVLIPERFAIALHFGDLEQAGRLAEHWISSTGSNLALLDQLSYQLLRAGGGDQAARLLLDAYPFGGGRGVVRQVLADRLSALLIEKPERMTAADRQLLAAPLDEAGERAQQAALFATLGRCEAVRDLLGDLAAQYREQDWMRLGDCYRPTLPGLAQHAYAQAAAHGDNGYATRTLAYQAFDNGDYPTALAAWQGLPVSELMPAELLAAATTAIAAAEPAQARQWLDAYQELGAVLGADYWWLLAQSSREPEEKRAALQQALTGHADTRFALALAELQREAGETRAAIRTLETALAADPGNPALLAPLGYAHWHAGDAERARDALESVHLAEPDNPALVEQLVYIDQRLADNESARLHARLAVDALQERQYDWTDAEREREYGLRRLHEDLGRRWTLNYGGFVGSTTGAVGYGGEPGAQFRSYGQIELDYRLGEPAIRAGRTLSAYGRVFAGSSGQEGGLDALPVHDAMLGAGLRWKPLRERIVYLAAEAQTPLGGDGATDLMLRASASLLNDGAFSDEWHPVGRGWLAQNLYLDAAYYLKRQRLATTADYRVGYHRKLEDGQTLEPYAHLQYQHVRHDGRQTDLRAGVGLRWHLRYGQTRYDAWRHQFSLGVEVQQVLDSDLPDKRAVMLTFGGHW